MSTNKKHKKHLKKVKEYFITTVNSELFNHTFLLQHRFLYDAFFSQLDVSNLYVVFCEDGRVMFTEKAFFEENYDHVNYGQIHIRYYYLKNVFTSKNIFGTRGWLCSCLPWDNENAFKIDNVKALAIKGDRIIPSRLLNDKEKINKKNLKEIQLFINHYLIDHSEYVNMLFGKESDKKVYRK